MEQNSVMDAQIAFEEAISEGRLSENAEDAHYAGHYMYMFQHKGRAQFKHIITRKYLP